MKLHVPIRSTILFIFFFVSLNTLASIKINGIYYTIMTKDGTAWVDKSEDAGGYKGDLVIPESITYNKKVYPVTAWTVDAFKNCSNLTSIELGSSIFKEYILLSLNGCNKLKNIYVNKDNPNYTSIDGVVYSKDMLSLEAYPIGRTGTFSIPEGIKNINICAFEYSNLNEINIPTSITYIPTITFDKCLTLSAINVAKENKKYSSIDGVLFDKHGKLERYPIGKGGSYTIPKGVTSIGVDAFENCNLNQIECPKTIITISRYAFENTKANIYINGTYSNYDFLQYLDKNSYVWVHHSDYDLAKKFFSEHLYNIEKFWVNVNETMLGKVTFSLPYYPWRQIMSTDPHNPDNGKIVDGYKIKTVTVNDKIIEPSNNNYTVDNLLPGKEYKVKLDWDRYSRKDVIAESGTDYDIITTKKAEFTAIQSGSSDYYDWNNDKEGRYYVSYHTDSLPAHVTASSDESLSPSEVGYYIKELKEYKKADEKGLVVVKDLYPATMLTFLPYAIYRGVRYEDESKQFRFKTPDPTCNVETSCTQTTVTIKSIAVVDYRNNKNTNPTSIRFTIDGKEYSWTGKPITIKGLYPNRYYGVSGNAIYGENHNVNISFNFQTESFHPSIYKISAGPTSIHVKGTYSLGDSKLEKAFFSDHDGEGDDIVVTGLKPNTKYSFKYWVKASGTSEYATLDVTTAKITIQSQNPKVLGNNSAIVCAKTNIENEEKGAGFEWRKTDAPDVVVSKSGSGVVYGGMLEGRINNLSTSSYYKVRPFYKASDGTMYYGEWIGFDPSDFSYFEPTVHTYARVSVQSTSAKVKGVALQGTDDITEQGFEYWAENAIASRAAGDKQIIQATGQSMEAEITDLAPNTTYNYRAYAKTSKGTTYGETLKFTTPVATAIIGITNTTNSDLQFNVRNTNNVQIAINGTDKECNYRMNSITGANVASGKTSADGEWHSITNYQLPSGIYIITVSDGKDKKSTKIAIK